MGLYLKEGIFFLVSFFFFYITRLCLTFYEFGSTFGPAGVQEPIV